jgi:two-component system NtrC family response regulator
LENICERITIFVAGVTVGPADIPDLTPSRPGTPSRFSFTLPNEGVSLEEVERAVILEALRRSDWNRSQAARFLRIPRHILIYRMQKFGIAERDAAGAPKARSTE